MPQSKTIKIFLASSITELHNERVMLGDYIMNSVRPIFKNDAVEIELIKCEDIHSGNSGSKSQEVIDRRIRECDISLFLFKNKVGKNTIHEFDVARELQDTKYHEIYIYCFETPEENKNEKLKAFQNRLEDEGLYWKTCNDVGSLESQLVIGLLQFERQLLGINVAPIIEQESETEKNGDTRFAKYESNEKEHEKKQAQLREMIHKDIDDLLQQVKSVMEDERDTIAARIFKAKELYEKADLWASKTDYDKKKYSHLLSNYAGFLYYYGLYRDSEAVYLRQISLAEELYGTEHKKTATSYNNIGLMYYLLSDYHKALEYYLKALKIYEKVSCKDHPAAATSYNNMGVVYWNKGDYPKALEYYSKALDIRKMVHGPYHPVTATSYHSIGLVYADQGNFPKALEYYFKALGIFVIYDKVLGKDHPATATSYNNIGAVYHAQGDYPQALEYYFKALEIDEKVLGTDHPSTARDNNNIGVVYKDQGNYPKALEYYFNALEIIEKKLGKDHPDAATSYHNIGLLYCATKENEKALEYLNKALEIREKKLGAKHPETQTTQRWINKVRAAMGEG